MGLTERLLRRLRGENSGRRLMFTSDPLTEEEQADLAHFAERSAARHGCSAPART